MPSAAEYLAALDAFMAAEKVIQGANLPFRWADGYSRHEKAAKFPLEYEQETQNGVHLLVIAFPNANVLKFRLSLCFHAALCRLDYTDEFHPNSFRLDGESVPPSINGPHFHSWAVNKRFFMSGAAAADLKNAVPFESPARTFDAILRWFCEETRIAGLGPGHGVELPRRETLI